MLDAGPMELLVPGLFHDYCVRRGAVYETATSTPGYYKIRPIRGPDHALDIMDDVMVHCGIGDVDRFKVRLALQATERFYWQKKDLSWTGT